MMRMRSAFSSSKARRSVRGDAGEIGRKGKMSVVRGRKKKGCCLGHYRDNFSVGFRGESIRGRGREGGWVRLDGEEAIHRICSGNICPKSYVSPN